MVNQQPADLRISIVSTLAEQAALNTAQFEDGVVMAVKENGRLYQFDKATDSWAVMGGGGGLQNLFDVLTEGDSAGGLDILDVGLLAVDDIDIGGLFDFFGTDFTVNASGLFVAEADGVALSALIGNLALDAAADMPLVALGTLSLSGGALELSGDGINNATWPVGAPLVGDVLTVQSVVGPSAVLEWAAGAAPVTPDLEAVLTAGDDAGALSITNLDTLDAVIINAEAAFLTDAFDLSGAGSFSSVTTGAALIQTDGNLQLDALNSFQASGDDVSISDGGSGTSINSLSDLTLTAAGTLLAGVTTFELNSTDASMLVDAFVVDAVSSIEMYATTFDVEAPTMHFVASGTYTAEAVDFLFTGGTFDVNVDDEILISTSTADIQVTAGLGNISFDAPAGDLNFDASAMNFTAPGPITNSTDDEFVIDADVLVFIASGLGSIQLNAPNGNVSINGGELRLNGDNSTTCTWPVGLPGVGDAIRVQSVAGSNVTLEWAP